MKEKIIIDLLVIFIMGFGVAGWLGHLLVYRILKRLRQKLKGDRLNKNERRLLSEDEEGKPLPRWMGVIERGMYVGAWILGYPQFIGLWLMLKVAGGWKWWQSGENGRIGRANFNIFLIGSGLSVLVAVVVALVVQYIVQFWF